MSVSAEEKTRRNNSTQWFHCLLSSFDTFFSYDLIKSKKWKVFYCFFLISCIQLAEGLWQIRCFLQHPVVNKALVPSGSCMPQLHSVNLGSALVWHHTQEGVPTSNLKMEIGKMLTQTWNLVVFWWTMSRHTRLWSPFAKALLETKIPFLLLCVLGWSTMLPRNGIVVTPRCHHTHRAPIYRVCWCRGTDATLCLTCFTYHFQCANPMARRKNRNPSVVQIWWTNPSHKLHKWLFDRMLRDSCLSTEDQRAASFFDVQAPNSMDYPIQKVTWDKQNRWANALKQFLFALPWRDPCPLRTFTS